MMKKTLALAISALLLTPLCGWAQDIITMKNGEDVKAKVLEVLPSEIKYKQYDNPEGPIFTVRKSEILMITYENGQRDMMKKTGNESLDSDSDRIWASNPDQLRNGMKYKELKNYYNPNDYYSMPGDQYSTTRCLWNLLLPGLGQMTMDEGGRGAAFLVGSLGLSAIGTLVGSAMMYSQAPEAGVIIFYAGNIAAFAVDIMSIVDAVKVAKVKDLYYRDLKNLASNVDIKFSPFVSPVRTANGFQPAAGLALTMNF